jgi:hypothetical protein
MELELELGDELDEVPEVVPELLVPADGELLLLLPDANVPVISTFSPTCLVSSLSCPSRMYLLPLDELLAVPAPDVPAPDVPLVLVPLVPLVLERDDEPLPIWALVRTNWPPLDEDELLVPLVDDVEPVPDVPVVPPLALPFWRHPVSVMVPLEL